MAEDRSTDGENKPLRVNLPPSFKSDQIQKYYEAWQLLVSTTGADVGLWENVELVSQFMREMGRRGGRKGGRAKVAKGFAKMDPEKRRQAALKGLASRWEKGGSM